MFIKFLIKFKIETKSQITIITQNCMQDQAFSLDQIINLVNHQSKSPAIQSNSQRVLTQNSIVNKALKYLHFKPWSGNKIIYNGYDSFAKNSQDCIHQQIEVISENSDEANDEIDEDHQKQRNSQTSPQKNADSGLTTQQKYAYRFQNGAVKLIKYFLQENGFSEGVGENWTIYWSSSAIKLQNYRKLLSYQKVNHFPNSFHITRKDLMNKTISKMQSKFGPSHFNFLPKSYILPQQMNQLIQQSERLRLKYIVKPHNRSQGKGITVTDSLATIYSKLQKYSSVIVSHYIDNPLLINKLKFDLRIYVAVTGVNPLRIYVYQEGLARFATEQYDSQMHDTESKKFQHLTNYSVNKKNVQFVPSDIDQYFGSKWTLTSLKDFLTFAIGRQQTLDLFDRIDDVLIKTIISVENTLFTSFNSYVPYINNCFEVFGFDILIDESLKPWLMEVNLSPSMNTDSPLDLKVKGNMIADLFTMIGVSSLQQRFAQNNHIKYQTHHFKKSDGQQHNQMSNIEKFVLKQVQLQKARSGAWKRIFPNSVSFKYKNFFESDRYFNKLVRDSLLISNDWNKRVNLDNTQKAIYQNRPLNNLRNKSGKQMPFSSTNIKDTGHQSINYRSNTLGQRQGITRNETGMSKKITIRINRSTNKNQIKQKNTKLKLLH